MLKQLMFLKFGNQYKYNHSILQIFNNKYNLQMKTTAQKTEEFFKTVQAGDISLFDLFQQAVAVFGFTKVGKTSSCHILANSPLKSQYVNGDFILRPATQKFITATVGNTPESQTQIPNIFEAKFRDKNSFKSITILDQPGYGDSYGFHRIFSNGYFHYRTFSKTPKLKFILAFKKVDLEGTGQKFKNTIQYFINAFSSFDSIIEDILDATAFLITQADPKSKIDNLKKIIQRLRDSAIGSMTTSERVRFQKFINNMLSKDKIFFIEKPEQAGIITKQCDILKQIYEKTTFWTRDVTNNIVDMSPINFSVGAEILNSLLSFKGKALFKEEFDHFMTFMEQRIKLFLISHQYSLLNIVKMLVNDAVNGVEDHNFLQGMSKFVTEFYKFNNLYDKQRQSREANLFKLAELNQSSDSSTLGLLNSEAAQLEKQQKQRQMRQIYFIKKFKVLSFIRQSSSKKELTNDHNIHRDVRWLEQVSNFFVELFRKFNYLRVQKTDSERIIYKYSYIIQRLIEESKIITLILFSNSETAARFNQYKKTIMVDVYRPLKDVVFVDFYEIDVGLLKQEFIKKLNFNMFETVNKEIIQFFQSIPHLSEGILIKIAQLISKYAETILNKKKNIPEDQKRYVAFKLYQYRNKFSAFLKNIIKENNKKQKEKIIQIIFGLTNHLGNYLTGLHLYESAREVFKSLNNSQFVFRNFDAQMKAYESDPGKTRSLLMDYGRYAGQCHRPELAMKCFQEAYAKSKYYDEFKEVSLEIMNLQIANQSKQSDTYLKRFFNEQFCTQFSESLKAQLSLIYEEEKIINY